MANINEYIEFQIHIYVFRVVLPILLAFGTAGNVTCILVLIKPKQRSSSTARYLLALAVSDLLMLWVSVPYQWLMSMYEINIREVSSASCKINMFLIIFSAQLSPVFISLLTLERFVCVMIPLKAKIICSIRNVNVVIISVTIGLALINTHLLYNFTILENGQCLPTDGTYKRIPFNLWLILQVSIFTFVPVIIVLVSNACILTSMCMRRYKFGKTATNGNLNSIRNKQTSRLNTLLLLVSATSLVCVVPIGIFHLLYGGDQLKYGETRHDARVILFWSICVVVYNTSNAINFILYFLTGSKFREETKKLCCTRVNI